MSICEDIIYMKITEKVQLPFLSKEIVTLKKDIDLNDTYNWDC